MAKNLADLTGARGKNGNGHTKPKSQGLRFGRFFTPPGSHAYDLVEWERRTAAITGEKGQVIFEQKDVEVPRSWSQLAINVVAQKYFRGRPGSPERETSVRQIIDRVVDTLATWGRADGYFATEEDAENWAEELRYLLVTQHASFNSPVWFNIGVPGRQQQASACFINSIDDSMESILDLVKTEGMLFKFGSGTGTNLSVLRSSREQLSGGGTASGPVSFMKGYDSFAGSIKSGGTTRRAAKMVILNADHPDVMDFIHSKAEEEKKAWALIEAGYNAGFNVPGGAYDSVQFQNANHSVRVSDDFMRAVIDDKEWKTRAVVDGRVIDTYKARDVWREISDAAWICGDPGLQFDSTIQDWNVVPNTGRINATNPCSEFVFVDDTACFAPDTRISTPNGLRTVAELFEQQQAGKPVLITTDIHSEHDHRRLLAHRPAQITRVGTRDVVRMTLRDGRSIRVTPDHRFLTDEGAWKRVDELEVGHDRIELRNSGDAVTFSSPQPEIDRWRMLGWLTGDGVFHGDVVALVFGPGEVRTAEAMTAELNLAKVAAAAGATVRSTSVSTQQSGVMQSSTTQRSLVHYLESVYGFQQATATGKDVPSAIHCAAADLKIAYLQGLFSADGCIRRNHLATEPEVMLASSSWGLLRSVQLILTDLGITSRISWAHPTGRANGQGQLHIYNQQARAFLTLVGFPLSDEKEKRANEVLAEPFAATLKNPRAATVVSIVPDGATTVYDVTEPVTHSLIAEGMIAHNCNLLSLNLMKFQNDEGKFDVERFQRAVDVCFTGQEILVSNASYPTPAIAKNSEALRPLGLGYANIGALLMSMGLAYDSDEGRRFSGAITAIMTGRAFAQSARMAQVKGPFTEYSKNREPMLRVMEKHRAAAYQLTTSPESADVITAARETWDEAVKLGRAHGYRNAQSTCLAPTGTIGLMMDCDTTGIEPDLALVKYKKLVGGGLLKIVNTTVPAALRKLGYDEIKVKEIVEYIDENDTIEGAPHLQDEHLKVFDCAFKPVKGTRSIAPMGHVRMMAAVQPFISGSMSKTVNLPTDATVEDIEQTYMESWKLGLKCIAIYRDGCKRSQPLSTSLEKEKKIAAPAQEVEYRAVRRKLPDERKAITHKFDIAGHEGYVTVGLYEDGTPGELFVTMAKEGSTISGLMDAFATQTSYALQFGVPLKFMVDKFSHMRFEPAGFTKNKEIPIAKSIVDYIFRWMASHFLPVEEQDEAGVIRRADAPEPIDDPKPAEAEFKVIAAPTTVQKLAFVNTGDAPACADCGAITVRSGSCYKCLNCGATTGCS